MTSQLKLEHPKQSGTETYLAFIEPVGAAAGEGREEDDGPVVGRVAGVIRWEGGVSQQTGRRWGFESGWEAMVRRR